MKTHFPSGHYTDVTYGNGGPSRHQCAGCGAPIVSRLEAWVHALTSSAACPGNTTASDEIAKAAGTPDSPATCEGGCWHLTSLHGPDGCTAKVYPAHSLTGEPCPCETATASEGEPT